MPVHETLRRATAQSHHALDHHPLMQRLTGSELSRECYAESLAAMYLPHARLEQQVLSSSHLPGSGVEVSGRLELLEADLVELGWSVAEDLQLSPRCEEPRAAWWGLVYVLEGSRLGGAFVARRIRSSLGDSVPCRFFGESIAADAVTGLLAMLERELEEQDELERAVASAQTAFGAYQAALDVFDGAQHGIIQLPRSCSV